MSLSNILRHLIRFWGLLAALNLLLALIGYSMAGTGQGPWQAFILSASLYMVVILAMSPFVFGQARYSSRREAVIFLFVFWVATPLFATPIYMAEDTPIMSAYRDSVAYLTTTGAMGTETPHISVIMHRMVFLLLGASMTISSFLIILPSFKISRDHIGGITAMKLADGDTLSKMMRIAQITFAVLLLATFVFAACLSLAEVEMMQAIGLTASVFSHGDLGLDWSGLSQTAMSPVPAILLCFALSVSIIGVMTMFFYPEAVTLWRKLRADIVCFLAIMTFACAIVFWQIGASFSHLLQLLSYISGSAIPFSKALSPLSQFSIMIYMLCLLGGSIWSGSTGIRFQRIISIFRTLTDEARSLSLPFSAATIRQSQHNTDITRLFTVGAAFAGMGLIIVIGQFTFSVFGHSYADSWRYAIGAFTNSGSLLEDLVSQHTNAVSNLSIILLMIFGRIEVLLLFILMLPQFWRR